MSINFKTLYRWLSSYELSVFLLLAWALYSLMLTVWGAVSPLPVVQRIARSAPFVIIYVLLTLNIVFCTLKGIRKKLKGPPSHWANILSHLAAILIVIGGLVSLMTRFEGQALVVEGHTFWGEKAEYLRTSDRGVPEVSFQVKEITPEFWEDKLLFTDLAALVSFPGDTLKEEKTLRLSSPISMNGIMVNIQNFSYTPDYIVRDDKGQELDSGTAVLTIFPPGVVDSFQPRGLPHRIYISLYPDYVVNRGRPESRTMSLKNPVFTLRVMRGKAMVYQGRVRPEEEIRFDGLSLEFPGIKKWGQFRVVRDGGVPYIFFGFFLGCLGLAWRFFPWTR